MTKKFLTSVAALALVVSACGSEGEGDASSELTGDPYVLAMINQDASPAGAYPEARESAEAVVSYINEELGGLHGRPLQLETCETDGSPEKSSTCARSLLEQEPLAFIGGVDFSSAASFSAMESAGIVQLGGMPLLEADFTSPSVVQFSPGSAGAFPALAAYVVETEQPTSVAIIHADTAAGREIATKYGADVLNRLGVTDVQLVAEAATAADFTPAVSRALSGDPDVLMVAQAAEGCSRVMQALQSLGANTPAYYISSCATHQIVEAAGSGAEGAVFAGNFPAIDGEDEDVQLYREVMEEYAPQTPLGGTGSYGYISMMNAYTILSAVAEDEVTPEKVMEAAKEDVVRPGTLVYDFNCNGEQLEGAPTVCTSFQRIWSWQDGQFVDATDEWIDGNV